MARAPLRLLLAALLLLGAAACDGPERQDPAALEGRAMAIGEWARVGALEAVLEGYAFDDESVDAAGDGRRWLLVRLLVRNAGDDGYTLRFATQLHAYDAGGEGYVVSEPEGGAPMRIALVPEGWLRAEVRFAVPEDAGPYWVQLEQPLGPERAVWALDVDAEGEMPEPAPVDAPPGALEPGTGATVGDARVTVEGYRAEEPGPLGQARRRVRIVAAVIVENRGRNDYTLAAPTQLRLQDAAGFLRARASIGSDDGALPNVIGPGETGRGEVTFEVPSDSGPPFYLTFSQALGDEVALWVLR